LAYTPEPETAGTIEWGRALDFIWKTHRVLEDASAIICSGRDDYTAASRKYPEKRVVYLPNGVDPNRFSHSDPAWFRKLYRIPEDRFIILSVDSIEMKKNQLTVIRQLPDVLDKAPDVHLVCIGDIENNEYFKRVRKEISLQKLQDRVTVIPGLPYESQDMINAYGAADAYIVPALYDAFGTSVLEAWSAGLPVAASKRGGPGYLVEHGRTGLLFDPEAPARFTESMKNALIELALNREASERYAAAGREKVLSAYTWDIITDQLLQLYQEVTAVR
jgi:glycosyltransferase involved in cell wall biosynthesis